MFFVVLFFVFKQKTAYEMLIIDWSSDVCSSDLMIAGMVRVMDQESSGVNIHYRACEYKFAPATRLGVARHRVSSRSGVDGVSDRGKQPPAGDRKSVV